MNSRIWVVPGEFPWRWVATRGNTHSLPSKSDNAEVSHSLFLSLWSETRDTIRKLKQCWLHKTYGLIIRPLRSPENQNVELQLSHHSSSSIQQRNQLRNYLLDASVTCIEGKIGIQIFVHGCFVFGNFLRWGLVLRSLHLSAHSTAKD